MIDIHTHFVPEQLPALPARSSEPTWPSMCPGRDCHHRHVMVKGDVYRVVTDQCWSAPRRIEDMAIRTLHMVEPDPGAVVIIERVATPAPPAKSIVAAR